MSVWANSVNDIQDAFVIRDEPIVGSTIGLVQYYSL